MDGVTTHNTTTHTDNVIPVFAAVAKLQWLRMIHRPKAPCECFDPETSHDPDPEREPRLTGVAMNLIFSETVKCTRHARRLDLIYN